MIDEKKLNTDDLCQICRSADCANCFSDEDFKKWIDSQPQIDGLYTRHEVACIIADLLGNTCACDYSGNDEWLPYYCEFAETVCPNTVGVACWEQYLTHKDKREKRDDQ